MYEDYKCVDCGAIEAKEDKVSTPQGDKCLDCVDSEVDMKTSKEMQLKILDKMRENVESGMHHYSGIETEFGGEWRDMENDEAFDFLDFGYRIKGYSIIINGVEIPKPLSKEQVMELAREKMLYIVSDNHKSFNTLNVGNVLAFGNRFVYETKEQAIKASKTLFGIEG